MTPDKHDELRRRGSLGSSGHGTLFIFEHGDGNFAVTVVLDDFDSEAELLAEAGRLVRFENWKRRLIERERAFLEEPSPATHVFDPLVWLRNNPDAGCDELRAAAEAAREAGFDVQGDLP